MIKGTVNNSFIHLNPRTITLSKLIMYCTKNISPCPPWILLKTSLALQFQMRGVLFADNWAEFCQIGDSSTLSVMLQQLALLNGSFYWTGTSWWWSFCIEWDPCISFNQSMNRTPRSIGRQMRWDVTTPISPFKPLIVYFSIAKGLMWGNLIPGIS